jgi:PleD family two-component response regulator
VTSPDAQSKRLERGTSREVVKNSKNETLVIAFARDISDRKALEVKLENLASLDYLTQVANRRQFDQYLESEWQRAWRDQTCLSLIMCDIDFFKLYNDCYGHQTGDKCLQQLVGAIANCLP